jgi:ATP-dependent exoDNAse (exonuclease V) beta subunit
VHSAQGVTADTTHAVLGENTTRAMLYVAMTRGRESNTAYLYQRTAGEGDHQHRGREDTHVARRDSSRDAAHLLRDIIAARDERARTAHDVSATTEREHLPEPVGSLVDLRTKAAERRCRNYSNWQEQTHTTTSDTERWTEQQISRTSSPDYGIQL